MVRAKVPHPRTDEEKARDKDRRLQREFGISLVLFNQYRIEQNDCCKICGGPLDAYGPPNVDHYHFHIKVSRHFDTGLLDDHGWDAQAFDELGNVKCVRWALTKGAAKAELKKVTLPWSVRGLLCFKCNRGLGAIEKFFNAARQPENLLNVIRYLRDRLQKTQKSS